jgi:hypothetical protein
MQTKSALFVFLIMLVFAGQNLHAQRGMEFGPTAGASYYMGDLNLYKHFYSPHLSLGVFGKYHINPRYAFALLGYIQGVGCRHDFNNHTLFVTENSSQTHRSFDVRS